MKINESNEKIIQDKHHSTRVTPKCTSCKNVSCHVSLLCVRVQQDGPLACCKNGEKLHAAAQPPSEGGGGVHRTKPVPSVPAPQQRHTDEEPEESCSVHLVCQEAVRDQPA